MTHAATTNSSRYWPDDLGLLRQLRKSPRDRQRWLDHAISAKGCARPIRLTGQLHTVNQTTGEILNTRHTHEFPDGVLYVPCGDRRASVCPACAEVYRADTYQLIKAGITGGKGVPESVAAHPAVFATLTAPSFGAVHAHSLHPRTGRLQPCHPRRRTRRCVHGHPMGCPQRHTDTGPLVGRPLCLDCYDHTGHLMWNAWSAELWRRTMISLNRLLTSLGTIHGVGLRASYGKVAEYQRRGVVHFHAIIRIDQINPADPATVLAPPPGITTTQLGALLARAVTTTHFATPAHPGTQQSWPIGWGRQLDIRPLAGLGRDMITPEAVAGYLAKYATKATEPSGLPTTSRLNTETIHYFANDSTHLGRLIAHAWKLGERPEDHTSEEQRHHWRDSFGRLRRWAHMLGFGGHFATKSRHYSTTHQALRAARRHWRRATLSHHQAHDHDTEDTTLIIGHLALAGVGWHTSADAQLAASAAARAREYRQIVKEECMTA